MHIDIWMNRVIKDHYWQVSTNVFFILQEEGCDFMSETYGELKIHMYEEHDGDKPTYMDMAEAIVSKLNEK